MDVENIIKKLEQFKEELNEEVSISYEEYESIHYGEQLFDSLLFRVKALVEQNGLRSVPLIPFIPKPAIGVYTKKTSQQIRVLNRKHFWSTRGAKLDAYLSALIVELQREGDEALLSSELNNDESNTKQSNKIFVVHGHDDGLKQGVLRFLEKLGLEGIVLHEQPSESRTIIEKIEHYSATVGFGVILYTKDDLGASKNDSDNLRPRARQNVVFEHGYLIGKLGRNRVIPLVEQDLEIPNDISGVVYVGTSSWQFEVAKELKAAGYHIDVNAIL
mgnify:FL=1|tara:strand:+ start:1630 stop:2451 length:822 start_codon:yes stop_codon:yes gene_type:complete